MPFIEVYLRIYCFIVLPIGREFKVQCLLFCQWQRFQSSVVHSSFIALTVRREFKVQCFINLPIGRSFKVHCSLLCQDEEVSKFNVHNSASWLMIQSSVFHSSAGRQETQVQYFIVLPIGIRFEVHKSYSFVNGQ